MKNLGEGDEESKGEGWEEETESITQAASKQLKRSG